MARFAGDSADLYLSIGEELDLSDADVRRMFLPDPKRPSLWVRLLRALRRWVR